MKKRFFFFFVCNWSILSFLFVQTFFGIGKEIKTRTPSYEGILVSNGYLKSNIPPYNVVSFSKTGLSKIVEKHGIEKKQSDFIPELSKKFPSISKIGVEINILKFRSLHSFLFVSLLIFQLILIFIGLSLLLYSLTRKKKNLNKDEYVNFLSMTNSNKSNGIVENSNPNQYLNRLYEQALEYMKTEKPFLNTNFSREKAASDLGTNRQYLTKAIRINADMTFGDFVFYFRLEYAKNLLLNNREMTIECASIESGFSTLSTFYRRFKKQYGMSPAMFRTFVSTNKDKTGFNERTHKNGFLKKEPDASRIMEMEMKTKKRRTRLGQTAKRVLKM